MTCLELHSGGLGHVKPIDEILVSLGVSVLDSAVVFADTLPLSPSVRLALSTRESMTSMDLLGSWPATNRGGHSSPFVTFYDVESGERTELSGTTTANWVAKVANLLVDDLDAEPGTRVEIALPTHWLRVVWILGAWAVGATVVDADGDVYLCGPDRLDSATSARHRVASALRPFGVPFTDPPAGFLDLGTELPGHPDAYIPFDDAGPHDPAVDVAGHALTFADLTTGSGSPDRLAFDDGGLARDVTATLAAVRGGGSLVLARHATAADLARIADTEHARLA